MEKQKYLIGNVSYGGLYTRVFLEHHLKSCLDETNIPGLIKAGYDPEFLILTDEETAPTIQNSEVFKRLVDLIPAHLSIFAWPPDLMINKFEQRYSIGAQLMNETMGQAIKTGAWCSVFAADLVLAQGCLPKMVKRLADGHDAVLGVPMRAGAEAFTYTLGHVTGAIRSRDLFRLAHDCQHPLWMTSHWGNPLGNKLPFTHLWGSGKGLLARSFSVSPLAFKPNSKMLEEANGTLDSTLPAFFENPYWAQDWTEAPICGVEFISCYYPPFHNRPNRAIEVGTWAKGLPKEQHPFLEREFYYPNKEMAGISPELKASSDAVVKEIQQCMG